MRTDSFNEKQFCRRDLVQCQIFSCLLGGIGLASTFLHLHKLQWQHQKQADLLMALLRKAAMPRPISFGEVLDERAPKRKACAVYVQNSPPKKRRDLKNKKQRQLSIFFQTKVLLYLQEWIAAVKVVSPGLWHSNFIARSHSEAWLQASTTVARDLQFFVLSPFLFSVCSFSNKHRT